MWHFDRLFIENFLYLAKKQVSKFVFWEKLWKSPLQNALILPAKIFSHLKFLVKHPTRNVLGAGRGIGQQQPNVELRRGREQVAVGVTHLDKLQPHRWT
jgi:hypothetical protein